MKMRTVRKCKRKLGCKKILLIVCLGCFTTYLISVVRRSLDIKEIWVGSGATNITDGHCGPVCLTGQVSFYIKTGEGRTTGPTICVQNHVIMHPSLDNVGRGLNIVIVDEKTLKVQRVQTYDTYLEDYEFLRAMKMAVNGGNLVFVSSFDEVSESLSAESRRFMKLLGSKLIDDIKFRDGFLLVGQKGLQQGHAIEFHEKRNGKVFADPVEKMGCFFLPLGPVAPVEEAMPKIIEAVEVKLGRAMKHCGMPLGCQDNEIAAMLSTGKDSTQLPEICVGDHIVTDKDTNNAGRGINVVIVDHQTGKPKFASRYDTYEKDSLNLELMIETLVEGDIVIMVIFDDGSRKLGSHTRDLLNELGSGLIQNLRFRDVWYMIGQKGIKGYTMFEKISYAGIDNEWPDPLKGSFCIPKQIIGTDMKPDPPVYRNDLKREFCKKYEGYTDFCEGHNIDSVPIVPTKLIDKQLQNNPVYSSPIIIIPGFNHNALVRTMETTIMQQGVSLDNVVVAYDEKFVEHGELGDLFGFRNISIAGSVEYGDHVRKAISTVAKMFQDSEFLIVLEEELVLSPDFLLFMAQCSQLLLDDDTLLGAAAFNYNGFEGMSHDLSLVYRVDEFPGLAAMIKMDVYKMRMSLNTKLCCHNRVWDGWQLPWDDYNHFGQILVPEVSRVYREPYEGVGEDETWLVQMFNQPRETNIERQPLLKDLNLLHKDQYDKVIEDILAKSTVLLRDDLQTCLQNKGRLQLQSKDKNYALYYNQSSAKDHSVIEKYKPCLGLVMSSKHPPRNSYKGIVRFTLQGNYLILIGSKSDFADHKPKEIRLLDA